MIKAVLVGLFVLLIVGFSLEEPRGVSVPNDFIGQYYDSFSTRSIQVCIGREAGEVHIGISSASSPYFITIFGRGFYTPDGLGVNGVDMYHLSNAGYSYGYFNFSRINSTYWTGVFHPIFGPLVGSQLTFSADQVTSEEPEEEFCTKPAPQPNAIYGLWEWLEEQNAAFHHAKGNFYSQTTGESVLGCWGYTDTALQEFAGYYNGTVVFENRGWIGNRVEYGDSDSSAIFFLRIGNTDSETKIVGYYLLPGDNDPEGYQILSNSATIQNTPNSCPVIGTVGCSQSESSSGSKMSKNLIHTIFH